MADRLRKIIGRFHPRQAMYLDYPVEAVPRYGRDYPIPVLCDIIADGCERYGAVLRTCHRYASDFAKWPYDQDGPDTPYWNNGFLPGLDMVCLYALVAERRPSRFVEIGSGNSTKVAVWAKRKHSQATKIVSIDPMPRAEVDGLVDDVIRTPLEKLDLTVCTSLENGDMLFVDNSHRSFPNSDVTVVCLEILPVLKPGVIVHLHDIYLPYDYPAWMAERFYNEQYLLAAMITANPGRYQTLLPCFYVSEHSELSRELTPIWRQLDERLERHGGSYWITIGGVSGPR